MQATARPQVTLKAEAFNEALAELGHTTNTAKAAFLGCGIATVSRLLNRDKDGNWSPVQRPGNEFIAKVSAAFPNRDLTDFFDFGGTR